MTTYLMYLYEVYYDLEVYYEKRQLPPPSGCPHHQDIRQAERNLRKWEPPL